MNSVRVGSVSGTFGVTAFLAGTLSVSALQEHAVAPVAVQGGYSICGVGATLAGSTKTAMMVIPSEADFLALALKLVVVQESLGEDFERILAANLASFLD